MPPPSSDIWKFTADGRGGGAWAQEAPPRDVVAMARNVRAVEGAWTQSEGVGFWVGGVASVHTDTSVTGDTQLALPGVVTFDMGSGRVGNESTGGLGGFGTRVGGGAQWTPFGGGEGVVVVVGGRDTPVRKGGEGEGASFDRVEVYDVEGGLLFLG